MKMTVQSSRITAWAALVLGFAAVWAQAAPQDKGFTYQGQVKVGGVPLTGTADLQFTLYNASTGGAAIGSQTVSNVVVDNGLFTVTLNAAGEMGAAAFDGNARWMGISVRSPAGVGVFTALAPLQALKSAPYAAYALNGGVVTIDNGTPGVMWTRSPNNIDVFLSSSTSAGIGFSSPTARLHVRAPSLAAETSRFEDIFGRSQLRLATPESAGRAELQAWNGQTNTAGALALNVAGGNVGIGTNAPAARLDVAGSFECDSLKLNGNGAALGNILTSDASGAAIWAPPPTSSQWTTNGTHIGYQGAGNVGIGTTSPGQKLTVVADSASGADARQILVRGATDANRQLLLGYQTTGDYGSIQSVHQNVAVTPLVLQPGGGNVGIGTTTPASKLDVAGMVTADDLAIVSTNYAAALVDSNNVAGTWLNLRNATSGGRYWKMISTGSGNGEGAGKLIIGSSTAASTLDVNALTIAQNGDIGLGTATPAAKLDIVGTARVQVLTITGGADVAEPFNINGDVSTTSAPKIEPGMVVTIDPDRVGELRVSSKAYDQAVAGVISGANGVNPGMVLTQTGSVADGKHPVALTGRVWCWCDADAAGPISAGDRLTTSDTPGHAMRVADPDRASGAVIGKAMSSLKSGQGLVLVLVNLQ